MDLEKLIEKREKFLDEHPHLKSYQEEIERILDATPDKFRFDVIMTLISVKLNEQKEQLQKLIKILEQ